MDKYEGLSDEARETVKSMIHHCLDNELRMGMDGGYDADECKYEWRKEIERFFNYEE